MSNIITSPTKSLSIALSNQKIPVYITKQEYDQMIQVQQEQINKAKTPRQKQIAIRNKLFLMCLFQTGARISEILQLTPNRINRQERTITLPCLKRKPKRSKGRPAKDSPVYIEKVIPISDTLRADLLDYCLTYNLRGDDRFFNFDRTYGFKLIRKIGQKAGIPTYKLHPHAFRHGFAVYCISSGVPISLVQEWLGHASILNTTIYAKITQIDGRIFFDNINW